MTRIIYSIFIGVISIYFYVKCETSAEILVTEFSTPLTKAVVTVITNFFIQRTSVITISRESQTYANKLDQLDIINDIMYKTAGKISYRFFAANMTTRILVRNRRRYNIIFIDDYESFKKIFTPENIQKFDVTGYFQLIITTHNKVKPLNMIEKMFKFAWSLYIININVLILNPDMETSALMYTYFPYTVQKCGDTTPIMSNIFVGKQFTKLVHFFPTKLQNLHNCPLYVATIHTPPFMIIDQQTSDTYRIEGFEGKLLKTLAKRLNFRLVIKLPTDHQRRGDIHKNGTTSGAIKLITEQKVNLTIGAWGSTKEFLSIMDATLNYFQSDLILIIPPGEPYTSFQKLFLPFDQTVWIMIGLQFVFSVLVVFGLKFVTETKRNFVIGRKNSSPLLCMISVFLGGPMCYMPGRNFARTLAMIWMLGCLVIRGTYQGSLFNFLQSQKNFSTADTINEMIERDFKFYVSEGGRQYIESVPNVRDRMVIFDLADRDYYYDRLRRSDFRGVLLSSRDHVAYANYKSRENDPIRIGKQQVMVFPITMYMPKGSYLTAQLNKELSKYLDSGLIGYWKNSMIDDRFLKQHAQSQEPIKMNFNHIAGGCHLSMLFLGASVIIFVLEVLSKWIWWIKKVLDFLTY